MHVIFSASWGSISDEVAPLIFSSKNLVFLLPSLLPNFSVCFIHGDPVKTSGEELWCSSLGKRGVEGTLVIPVLKRAIKEN
jgi:hypothetical protein